MISLSEELDNLLAKEKNASGVIARALENYYKSKDSAVKLVKLAEDFENSMPAVIEMFEDLQASMKDIGRIRADVSFIRSRAEQ